LAVHCHAPVRIARHARQLRTKAARCARTIRKTDTGKTPPEAKSTVRGSVPQPQAECINAWRITGHATKPAAVKLAHREWTGTFIPRPPCKGLFDCYQSSLAALVKVPRLSR